METHHWGWGDAQLTLAPPCPRSGLALGCSWEWGLEVEERVCADCPAWSRAGWKFSITLTLHERCDPTV